MKWIKALVWVSALLIAGLVYSQTQVITDERAALDELLASVLSPEPPPPLNLPLVASSAVPESATFWSAQAFEDSPPYPFNPVADLGLPVYSLGANSFIFDDRAVNYEVWRQVQTAMRLLDSGMTLNSLDFPEFPGEGEGEGGEWTNNYVPIVYGSNDLWLELVSGSVTNGMADLIIHNPQDLTNSPVWDLYATTNLNVEWPGLNGTNWTWLLRTDPGQTNVTVLQISEEQAYYRIADTNDADEDGLTDVFEALVSHSSALTNDTDGDGLLDGWEWKHFGSFAPGDTEDYDNDGTNNITEQTNETNPNDLSFRNRFPDFFVNQTSVIGYCEVEAGVPFEVAVLVNNTNLAAAQWLPYAGNFATSLGTTDGVYTVRVALRGRDPVFPPVWDDTQIILDRVAPVLAITNPVSLPATVLKPYLQLIGNADEPLIQLTYSLSNLFGLQTNLSAHVVDQDFDTNAFDFTTNWFQAYDVPLATNLNAITLQVTDRAGNVSSTNLQVTLNYDGATNPPVTQLLWPTNGVTMAGDTMTLRGQIDDETASVSVRWVDGGQTNTWPGIVERNGRFWVEGLPLNPGTNELTLVAQNAAGRVSETGFTVNRGVLNLAVTYTTEGEQLYDSFGYAGGTVDPGCSVTVNGVEATVDESGNWSATDVPLYGRGLAVFDVSATPGGGSSSLRMGEMSSLTSGGGTEYLTLTKEMPAAIRIVKHFVKQDYTYPGNQHTWTKTYRAWDETQADGSLRHRYQGTVSEYWALFNYFGPTMIDYAWSDTNVIGSFQRTSSVGGGSSGPMTGEDWLVRTVPDQHFDHVALSEYYVTHFHARRVRHEWPESGQVETLEARTQLRLYTGGRAELGRSSLISVGADVVDYGQPQSPEWFYTPATTVEATQKRFFGKPADATGRVYLVAADGAELKVDTEIAGSEHYGANYNKAQSRLALESVTFQGDGYRSILNDTNGDPYPTPHWEINRSTHAVSSYPVLYVSGSQMVARVRFALEPSENDTSVGVIGAGGGFAFTGTTNVSRWATNVDVTVVATEGFPLEKVDFLNPLTITWKYAWANDLTNFQAAGTSTNQVYVTWREPQSYANLRHTVVHLACTNTGATLADSVVANTWTNFAGPANVTTWDRKPLRYYETNTPTSGAVRTLSALLSGTNYNSQCDSLEELFREALHVNGIAFGTGYRTCAKYTINTPSGENFFLVKSWTFGATNSSTDNYKWTLEVGKDAEGNPEMVPASNLSGSVSNALGIAGQNSSTPAEKIFGRHFVVRYTDSAGLNTLYDPSYGRTYSSDADFFEQAVAGFGKTDLENTNSTIVRLKIRQ